MPELACKSPIALRRTAPSPPWTERWRGCIATGRISMLDLLPNPDRVHHPSRHEIDQELRSFPLAGKPRERRSGDKPSERVWIGTVRWSRVIVVMAARGVSFVHLLPHRGRGVRRGAFSETVFPGKPMPLGERVCGEADPCPFFDSAAAAHRMRTPWRTWLGSFRRPPPVDT